MKKAKIRAVFCSLWWTGPGQKNVLRGALLGGSRKTGERQRERERERERKIRHAKIDASIRSPQMLK